MWPLTDTSPASEPVLDPQALVRLREGGGPELIVELVDLFLSDGPGLLQRVLDGEGPAQGRAAHAFKGSCLSLGLNELAGLCRRIELAVEAGEPCAEVLPALQPAYARAVAALRQAKAQAQAG